MLLYVCREQWWMLAIVHNEYELIKVFPVFPVKTVFSFKVCQLLFLSTSIHCTCYYSF